MTCMKASEHTRLPPDKSTKEDGLRTCSMGKGFIPGRMVINLKVITSREKEMVTENFSIETDSHILENGKMG